MRNKPFCCGLQKWRVAHFGEHFRGLRVNKRYHHLLSGGKNDSGCQVKSYLVNRPYQKYRVQPEFVESFKFV